MLVLKSKVMKMSEGYEKTIKELTGALEELLLHTRQLEKGGLYVSKKDKITIGDVYFVESEPSVDMRTVLKIEGKYFIKETDLSGNTKSVDRFKRDFPNGANNLEDIAKYMQKSKYMKAKRK